MKEREFEVYDFRGTFNLLAELPKVRAATPKQAAEKHAGARVQRLDARARSGQLLVKATAYPFTSYLYNVVEPR